MLLEGHGERGYGDTRTDSETLEKMDTVTTGAYVSGESGNIHQWLADANY